MLFSFLKLEASIYQKIKCNFVAVPSRLTKKRMGREEWIVEVVGLFYVYGLAFGFLFFLFGDSDV